jgi:hypothetical protein
MPKSRPLTAAPVVGTALAAEQPRSQTLASTSSDKQPPALWRAGSSPFRWSSFSKKDLTSPKADGNGETALRSPVRILCCLLCKIYQFSYSFYLPVLYWADLPVVIIDNR